MINRIPFNKPITGHFFAAFSPNKTGFVKSVSTRFIYHQPIHHSALFSDPRRGLVAKLIRNFWYIRFFLDSDSKYFIFEKLQISGNLVQKKNWLWTRSNGKKIHFEAVRNLTNFGYKYYDSILRSQVSSWLDSKKKRFNGGAWFFIMFLLQFTF